MPSPATEPAPARPRGLPGLSRRDDRTAWLTAVPGDLRIAALAYVARQAATAGTSRTRDAGLVDIHAIPGRWPTGCEAYVEAHQPSRGRVLQDQETRVGAGRDERAVAGAGAARARTIWMPAAEASRH